MAEEKQVDQDRDNSVKEEAGLMAHVGSTPVNDPGSSHDITLMPTVLSNFMIAEQYIDETKFPDEHMLICFHYGVAMLATGRNVRAKREMASRFFTAALGWERGASKDDARNEAIDRIVSESQYNLGVIDELNGDFSKAHEHYLLAVEISASEKYSVRFNNVSILAQLGIISSRIGSIRKEYPTKGSPEAEHRVEPLFSGISVTLLKKIETTRTRISALREQIEQLQKKVPEHPPQTLRAVRAKASRIGGFLDFIRRSAMQSESTIPDEGEFTEEPSTILRRHEVLDEIIEQLGVFDSELNGFLPPPIAKRTP
jgi:hypothetical protein